MKKKRGKLHVLMRGNPFQWGEQIMHKINKYLVGWMVLGAVEKNKVGSRDDLK